MLKKTIAKFYVFVIFAAAVSAFFSACAYVGSDSPRSDAGSRYSAPKVNGKIASSDITESSGIAASRCQSNVLWTHNDSGDDAFIFALNTTGGSLGTWRIPNAQNIDWEDIATYKDKAGKCFVFIGEIGDNKAKRHEHTIYRIQEPIVIPANANSSRKDPIISSEAEAVNFTYPDYDQDAETIMVNPKNGDIYVITKRVSGPAGIYRLKPDFGKAEPQKAESVAELSVPAIPNGFLTGGDISPDGRRVIICDYSQAYEYVLPGKATNFDDIWKQTPEPVELGARSAGEAICYSVDGTSLFATSEGRNAPLIEVKRR
ncbi:hypothetical protein BH10ACI3_BH10ACI3_19700 [soil metagenome]